ncbi:MICOS complex subunit MIC60 [Skeletonema marinoi]|uniref:MICOS complex subunit MIC60 n=2 Tax=Skeletonema marinoi TaxID=267567 RepID=A0AAD8YI56_9STRA|nr:MICOS complex subunit MIC60 [Skeletonema marinoi]
MLLSRTLRRTTTAISLQQQQQRRGRTLVTSAQKRALNKTQLEGTKDAPPPTAAAAKATPPSSGGVAAVEGGAASSSGGGIGKFGLPLLLIGAAGGGTVYMANEKNMSPYDYIMSLTGAATKKKEKSAELTNAMKEAVQEITKEEAAPSASAAPAVADVVVETTANETKEEQEEIVVSLEHPENGNRVDIDKITSFYKTVNEGHAKQQQQQQKAQEELDAAQESATKATQYNESNQTTTTDPTVALTTATAAMSELQTTTSLQNSKTLAAANAALRSDLDREYFTDLDSLTASELRTRVVQLATEMSDRTKWEAVRLKEFLAMKEKEVGDNYLTILQKQRLEFEALLAQKLREQEDVITRQANAALQAKEDSIANLLRATSEAREKETQDVLSSEMKRVTDELELEYTSKLHNELAKMKQAYAKDLEKHGSVMEMLQGKLELLSSRLEVSQTYECGSKRAHRVSAAALALASKLEDGEGAAVEIAALKGAAGGEGVIASAVGMIPPTAEEGVPTVAELQVAFDQSYNVGRQAAMVPEGRAGLEGQLMGMVFAKLSVPPSPEAVPTSEEEGNVTDGVLSLARKYVQVGDLEKAVEQLNKLKGQAAYVMNDWKSKAADRVSTERALKVIKLECALLNKELV